LSPYVAYVERGFGRPVAGSTGAQLWLGYFQGLGSLDAFEADWQKQWLIERGVEIVSEASRHLTAELKARNPDIPWAKVAGIGNVLRHDYGNIAAAIIWKLVRDDLPPLERIWRLQSTKLPRRRGILSTRPALSNVG